MEIGLRGASWRRKTRGSPGGSIASIALCAVLVATGCGAQSPTVAPTGVPTAAPSGGPTSVPTAGATATEAVPTVAPTVEPTQAEPTPAPAAQVLRINWPPYPTLDPAIVTSGMWLYAMGLGEGLVSQTDDGQDVVPAVADTWEESTDGLTWTFHIRDGATWSDGSALTSDDFIATYQRLLDPATAEAGVSLGSNSFRTGLGIVGAEDFLNGISSDWSTVGITAPDPSDVEFNLVARNSVFLLGLTHPSMFPLKISNLTEYPDDWQTPEQWIGNGPFVPTSWVINSQLDMAPNENYWDRANVHLTEVQVKTAEPSSPASMIAYENDEVDLTSVSDADLPRLQSDPAQSANLARVAGAAVWFIHIMRSENPILEDINIRKALSLGMGRATISSVIPGTVPGVSLVPNNVPGWDPGLAIQEDVDAARELLTAAGHPNGEGIPPLSIMTDAPYPVLEALVDQWKTNLNVTAQLDTVDIGVYVDRRFAVQTGDYTGFVFNTYGGQETNWPYNLLATWSPENILNYSLPAEAWAEYLEVQADTTMDPADQTAELTRIREENATPEAKLYADLAEQAFAETDPAAQIDLFNQAAKARDDTYLVVPVLWSDAFWIVNPRVTNIHFRLTLEQFYLKGVSISE